MLESCSSEMFVPTIIASIEISSYTAPGQSMEHTLYKYLYSTPVNVDPSDQLAARQFIKKYNFSTLQLCL